MGFWWLWRTGYGLLVAMEDRVWALGGYGGQGTAFWRLKRAGYGKSTKCWPGTGLSLVHTSNM